MVKPIEILKDNKSLEVFNSVNEIVNKSKELFGIEFKRCNVYNACNGSDGASNIYKGYVFKYVDVQVEIFKGNKSLGIFKSGADIEKQSEKLFGVKIFNSGIRNICEGKGKTYKGYTFKYTINRDDLNISQFVNLNKDMKKSKEVYKKVFLDELPIWGKDGLGIKGTINWKESIGESVKFIYGDIEGELKIVECDSKSNSIYIKYLDKSPFKISTDGFRNGRFGKYLEVYQKLQDFLYDINQVIEDDAKTITIIDRKKTKDNRGYIQKWYKYRCNKCGRVKGWIKQCKIKAINRCTCSNNYINNSLNIEYTNKVADSVAIKQEEVSEVNSKYEQKLKSIMVYALALLECSEIEEAKDLLKKEINKFRRGE